MGEVDILDGGKVEKGRDGRNAVAYLRLIPQPKITAHMSAIERGTKTGESDKTRVR